MSDARRYAVWPDPRSRSRALQNWNSRHFQKLSPPPFTMRAGNWPRILKLGHNNYIWLGLIIYDIWHSFFVMWVWSWQKRHFWRVVHQSFIRLIFQSVSQPQSHRIGWTLIILFRYSFFCIYSKCTIYNLYRYKTQLCNGLADWSNEWICVYELCKWNCTGCFLWLLLYCRNREPN